MAPPKTAYEWPPKQQPTQPDGNTRGQVHPHRRGSAVIRKGEPPRIATCQGPTPSRQRKQVPLYLSKSGQETALDQSPVTSSLYTRRHREREPQLTKPTTILLTRINNGEPVADLPSWEPKESHETLREQRLTYLKTRASEGKEQAEEHRTSTAKDITATMQRK